MIDELKQLEKLLIHHEGLRLKPYRCPAGKWTIGIGRNIEDNGISKDEALLMLMNDLSISSKELADVFKEQTFSFPRRAALADMMFNLGRPRFETFKKMIAAVKVEDFKTAAKEMLDSKWAKQVGKRAKTLAKIMRTGEWPEFLDFGNEKGGVHEVD